MIEIQTQIRNQCPVCRATFGPFYLPYGPESVDKTKEYRLNQIVNNKITGSTKERSLAQLGTYFAVCQAVADNTDHPRWNTKKKTDFQCRVETDFRDPDVVAVKKNGDVVFQYRSISFDNLKHIEACNYFDQAFAIMAKFLGVDVDTLIRMAKDNMGRS